MSRKNEAKPGIVVDERAVGGPRGGGQLVDDRRADRQGAFETGVVLGCGRLEDRAGHLLEVAAGDRRVGVVGGDDLALLGELEPGVDRARRLAEDRPVRRSPTPSERAAAAVEEGQRDAARLGRLDQRRLRLVEQPGGRQEARFLVRVRVAEHHLLAIAARREAGAVRRVVEQRAEDRAGRLERLARFEERDEVEDGRRVRVAVAVGGRQGVAGELEDVGDVAGRRGEADDVAMAGLGAEPCLARGDRPERGEDLVERHAGGDLRLAGRPGADRRERRGMHRRVLADLERGEVEPERPELPAQFRDLAPGGAAETVGDERVGDLGQLRVELLGRRVAPGQRRRLADEVRARPAQPLGDEPEALAVRLVGEAAAELAVGLGQVLGVACQARGERPRHAIARGRGRDRLHQPRRDGLVAAQDVVGLDAQRALGDLRGHARVAVTVPADPAPEPQERPDAWRPRPRPAGVRGGTRRATRRRIERRVERPVEPRDDREQRGVEERHRRPHLVERGRADDAQVRGPPQQRDLLAQLAPELAVLGRGQARVVGARQQDRRSGAAPPASSGGGPRSGARSGPARPRAGRSARPARRRSAPGGAARRSRRRPSPGGSRRVPRARVDAASGPGRAPRPG